MREVKVNISCSAFDEFSPNANTYNSAYEN